jgi:hypothetical protein
MHSLRLGPQAKLATFAAISLPLVSVSCHLFSIAISHLPWHGLFAECAVIRVFPLRISGVIVRASVWDGYRLKLAANWPQTTEPFMNRARPENSLVQAWRHGSRVLSGGVAAMGAYFRSWVASTINLSPSSPASKTSGCAIVLTFYWVLDVLAHRVSQTTASVSFRLDLPQPWEGRGHSSATARDCVSPVNEMRPCDATTLASAELSKSTANFTSSLRSHLQTECKCDHSSRFSLWQYLH